MTDHELNKKKALQKLIKETQDPFSKKEVREKIVELVIKHVEENGSCRVGWAANEIIGKEQQNHIHDKIAGLVTRTNKYIKERNALFPKDWNIYLNPNYEFGQISKKTSIVQRKALYITVGVSILTLVIQGFNVWISAANREMQKDLQQQIRDLKSPALQADSLTTHRLVSDSVK